MAKGRPIHKGLTHYENGGQVKKTKPKTKCK